jgi:hypothetical protein
MNATGFGFFLNGDDSSHIFFQTRNGSTISQVDGGFVNNNIWHHILGIRDHSANTTKIYVDGILKSTDVTVLSSGYSSSESFALGARSGLGGWGFYSNGLIDDVKVWNYESPDK